MSIVEIVKLWIRMAGFLKKMTATFCSIAVVSIRILRDLVVIQYVSLTR